ncbi:choline ABC transporter permease subunit [Stakelama sp. CBK3Z-3]|uniref:Choline ABC transporter permease subunit n=1 Tax=Stakelama flava TaxID=2860338 RepID=A0ABS6XN41_9SPHN|nr:choline ABC transporter permease subunit [Stakelama flava]MBW4331627.1 choline ABC transporter permease subunit [Stakelama flava]
MRRFMAIFMLALFALVAVNPAYAKAEAKACRTVRLADVGWTDVTATTGMLARILSGLGYHPKVSVLSVPVTLNGLHRGDVDVFLGNWMPMQTSDIAPYIKDGSIVRVRANLIDARYTLAVPEYLYKQGLTDFSSIADFGDELQHRIYGIEAGNDGNRLVLDMIAHDKFGLGDFDLVESSEQGMLAQVERAVRQKKPIVFLGWQPHPMNDRFDMRYLSGGDDVFGPNFGGAKVYTTVRQGFLDQCPNVGRLLKNLSFNVEDENVLMAGVTKTGNAQGTAQRWLAAHPKRLQQWLQGVTTIDGKPAGPAMMKGLTPEPTGNFITRNKIPVGDWIADAVEWTKSHSALLDLISTGVSASVKALTGALSAIPPLLFVLLATVLTWALRRSIPITVFVPLALLFIINQGYWAATIQTLALVVFAAAISTAVGVPIGIWAGHRPRAYEGLRSVLDLMQTLPTFVYLIPTLVVFGLGVVPGLISTIIFALPAPIRLTQLGIMSVPKPLLEAGKSFGATKWQLLLRVELPAAAGSILAGITQCIMLSLSMVVIAALVGAGGLGVPVVRALNTVQVGMGFEAGFAIVLLAIILDRVTRRETKGDN